MNRTQTPEKGREGTQKASEGSGPCLDTSGRCNAVQGLYGDVFAFDWDDAEGVKTFISKLEGAGEASKRLQRITPCDEKEDEK